MKYTIKKENKPTLSTYGKYKAVVCHYQTVESQQIIRETARRIGMNEGDVTAAVIGMANVISDHLRQGDKIRLRDWGLMKLEIESDKVDTPEAFKARKHIRGVRLHFLPESAKGTPELYQGITFEKQK